MDYYFAVDFWVWHGSLIITANTINQCTINPVTDRIIYRNEAIPRFYFISNDWTMTSTRPKYFR